MLVYVPRYEPWEFSASFRITESATVRVDFGQGQDALRVSQFSLNSTTAQVIEAAVADLLSDLEQGAPAGR